MKINMMQIHDGGIARGVTLPSIYTMFWGLDLTCLVFDSFVLLTLDSTSPEPVT